MGVPKSRTQLSDFTFTFHFHALEKEMATHSSVLAWRIPGTVEPDGLPSMGVAQSRTRLKRLSSSSGGSSSIHTALALTIGTSVGNVMSLLFNMLSRLVITFLPRSKHLLISWLQSPSAVILEPPKIKSATVFFVTISKPTISPQCHL